jgi:amidase
MTRTVEEAALLLSVMGGTDIADPATAEADMRKTDYPAELSFASLKGKRLGVIAADPFAPANAEDGVFRKAISALAAAGANIVEIENLVLPPEMAALELIVLGFELKHYLNAYLASLPESLPVKSLSDVIAFNASAERETVLFGQDIFQKVEATDGLANPIYVRARDSLREFSRNALDRLFNGMSLDALIGATDAPSSRIDIVKGDKNSGALSFFPATAGYPHLTVPMGYVSGLPVGLSFIGPAWSEARLLALGHAFEKIMPVREPPSFRATLEDAPEMMSAFAPLRI